jgi:hypothetical protein
MSFQLSGSIWVVAPHGLCRDSSSSKLIGHRLGMVDIGTVDDGLSSLTDSLPSIHDLLIAFGCVDPFRKFSETEITG